MCSMPRALTVAELAAELNLYDPATPVFVMVPDRPNPDWASVLPIGAAGVGEVVPDDLLRDALYLRAVRPD